MAKCICCGKVAGYFESDRDWLALAYHSERVEIEDPTLMPRQYTYSIIEKVPFCSVQIRELVSTPDWNNIWGICPDCQKNAGRDEH